MQRERGVCVWPSQTPVFVPHPLRPDVLRPHPAQKPLERVKGPGPPREGPWGRADRGVGLTATSVKSAVVSFLLFPGAWDQVGEGGWQSRHNPWSRRPPAEIQREHREGGSARPLGVPLGF